MPAPYRTRNALVLARTETTPGVDAEPTPTSDAVLVEDPTPRHELLSVDTREVTGDLDVGASIPAGGSLAMELSAPLRGSGAAATPPRIGPLLKAGALAETVTSSAITGTAQGGTTTTIQLAGSASSASHAYVGMLIGISSGTGAGQVRVIVAYSGSTRTATVRPAWDIVPDATSNYSIFANVQYRPGVAEAPCTIYHYHHHADGVNSKLTKMIGAVTTGSIDLAVRDIPRLRVQARAQLTSASDVTRPGTPTYEQTQPPAWINAPTVVGATRMSVAQLALDFGNSVQVLDNPNEPFGFDRPLIAERSISVRMRVPVDTQSALDAVGSWNVGTVYPIATYWGSAVGNRIALVVPEARITGVRYIDDRGALYYELNARPNIDAAVPFTLTFC